MTIYVCGFSCGARAKPRVSDDTHMNIYRFEDARGKPEANLSWDTVGAGAGDLAGNPLGVEFFFKVVLKRGHRGPANWLTSIVIFARGHTATNRPDLFRTPKLTAAGPGQYWAGGPPGNTLGCR